MNKIINKINCFVFGHIVKWGLYSMRDGEYCVNGCGKHFSVEELKIRIKNYE